MLSIEIKLLPTALVTDTQDCKGQSSSLIVNGLNLNSNFKTDLSIYPNPFANELTLMTSSTVSFDYQLTDTRGRILTTGIFQKQLSINTTNLPLGVYLLQLRNKKQTNVYKILKQ